VVRRARHGARPGVLAPLALAALAALAALSLALTASAGADSFTPVRLDITIAPVARLHVPLPITVKVSADSGVLDTATSPLRMRAKLAAECGGSFSTTSGVVLLDQVLSPQPSTGHAYQATAKGSGRPTAYGNRVVCAYLEEQGDGRMYANDTDNPPTVTVAPKCTQAASRYDSAAASLARARRQLSHAKTKQARKGARTLVAKRAKTAAADRRSARAACGPGVTL
jgi:hypothetical protein